MPVLDPDPLNHRYTQMTVATTQTQKATPATQGRIALWRCSPEKRATFTGKVSVTPAMLRELSAQTPDKYGQIHLDVIGFPNEGGENAPAYTGYCRLPQERDSAPEGFDEF